VSSQLRTAKVEAARKRKTDTMKLKWLPDPQSKRKDWLTEANAWSSSAAGGDKQDSSQPICQWATGTSIADKPKIYPEPSSIKIVGAALKT
jgi:argininosuccinate synthase